MEKRLTRSEMFFSLGFLFMLVFAVGAFFYGIKVGSDKTEAKFIEQTKYLSSSNSSAAPAYQQQDLVSFYHTVFLPYREFQTSWSQTIHELSAGQIQDPSPAFEQLSSLAQRKYDEAKNASISKASPLLEQAQIQLLNGLDSFAKAAQRGASLTKELPSAKVIASLHNDANYLQGVTQAMTGQRNYYHSMVKWSSSVDPNITDRFHSSPAALGIQGWKSLPLTIKNKLMADQLKTKMLITSFYPQDLTSRVDDFIASGEARKMKMKTVDSIIDLLLSTEAVRPGDFIDNKEHLYAKEVLPQLPFFYPEQQ